MINPWRVFSRWLHQSGRRDPRLADLADWTMPVTGENVVDFGPLVGANVLEMGSLDGSQMDSFGTVEGSGDGD